LLGQVGMNLGNGKLAFDSYQQANKLEPDNLDYKLSYARMLMSSEDQTDKLKGNQLLREIIRQDHSNPEALSLLAFSYFEGEDYKMAAVTWAMMLRLLEPMKPQLLGFHHIAIIASNYARSKHFYMEILGAKQLNETYRVERDSYKLDLSFPDGSQIELFSFPNPPKRVTNPEACGLRHLAFKVDNIDEYVAYLLENSINCEPIRVDELTGMKYTFFRDPDYLPIELYENNY